MDSLDPDQFAKYSPSERLDMAIEMTSVTLEICWESIRQTKPGLSEEAYREIFAKRLGVRRVSSLSDEGN